MAKKSIINSAVSAIKKIFDFVVKPKCSQPLSPTKFAESLIKKMMRNKWSSCLLGAEYSQKVMQKNLNLQKSPQSCFETNVAFFSADTQ